MSNDYMLTTDDNPFNPHNMFDEWYAWDVANGYNTLGMLGQVAPDSDELTEHWYNVLYDKAVDELLDLNPTGNLRKIRAGEVVTPIDSVVAD